MQIELKKAIRNKFFVIFILINILSVILGYILLVTIDKVQNITFELLFESVYTVYTQFGVLLFSTPLITQFYNDYKEKNIFFYKTLGFNGTKYYLYKIGMIIVITIIGSMLSSIIITIPYGKISSLFIIFLKIEAVMIYYTVIASTISFIFTNFICSFFINLLLWIIGIVISAFSPYLKYFAYYDASNNDYKNLISYLQYKISFGELLQFILGNYIYDIIVLLICIIVVRILNKRWLRNGI